MGDAECVPENNIGVVDGSVAIGDPFGNTFGGLTRGLRDMAASGENLVIIV